MHDDDDDDDEDDDDIDTSLQKLISQVFKIFLDITILSFLGTENATIYQHIVSSCHEITTLPSATPNTKTRRICYHLAHEVFCILGIFIQNCDELLTPSDSP